MALIKTSLQRWMLLEEGAVAILPLSRQPSERGGWNVTFLLQCPSVSASISHMYLKGKKPQPTNPNIAREWNKAGWSACGIPGWLIEMQCFQQLPAASVFPGFLFHTLLSFRFVVFSPHFVSCFHLPWLLAALCCVCAVLNPVGLERQVCLHVFVPVLAPVLWSTAPTLFPGQCWRATLCWEAVMALTTRVNYSHWTWSAHCPSAHIAHFGSGGWVFPASSPGRFPNSNSLWCKKKEVKISDWWLPAWRVRVSDCPGLSHYFGTSGKCVVVLRTFVVLEAE